METDLDKLAKEKGIICWIVPCSFSYPPHKVTWGYEIEVLPYSEMGKYYCESEHKSNMFYPYQEWDTYDEAKQKMIERANKIFDEWRLAVTTKE